MALDYVLTHELQIVYNSLVIAKTSSFSFSSGVDTIEVTNIDGYPNKEYKKGYRDFTISFDSLFTRGTPDAGEIDYKALLDDLISNDTPVTVALVPLEASAEYKEGQGYLTSLDLSGSVNEAMTYSGEIQITGGVQTVTTPAAATATAQSKAKAK